MWFLQRTDVNLRNEWSNYSNWDYMSYSKQKKKLLVTTQVN